MTTHPSFKATKEGKIMKVSDAKITGYGVLEIAKGAFQNRLNKTYESIQEIGRYRALKIPVTIKGFITDRNNFPDDVGQEWVIDVEKVEFEAVLNG